MISVQRCVASAWRSSRDPEQHQWRAKEFASPNMAWHGNYKMLLLTELKALQNLRRTILAGIRQHFEPLWCFGACSSKGPASI
jgi:hypothetical protein